MVLIDNFDALLFY